MKKTATKKGTLKTIELPINNFPLSEWFDRYAVYLVIVLMIAGFLLREYRLDFLSLWTDEFIIPDQAAGVFQGKSILSHHDNNGIFLTVLVFLNYSIFGISDYAARIVSVILGTLVIPATYFLGKILFNRFVGCIAAALATVSVYSVFWSRVSRNYASFELFYLLLIIVFWLMFEGVKSGNATGWLDRHGIQKKYLILFPFALLASLLNHQLTFFFIFTFMAYGSTMALWNLFQKRDGRFTNKYSWILYGTLLFVFLFYTPFMADIIRPVVGLVMHEEGVLWFIPRWDIIFNMWASAEPTKVFNIYMSVFKVDFPNYWRLGFIGLIAAFFFQRKSAVFLISLFIVPLLLMSFVFYDPATTRYLIYVYPFFLIGVGVAVYGIWRLIGLYLLPLSWSPRTVINITAVLATVAVLISFASIKDLKALINPQRHGMVARGEISNWFFSNWQEASQNVKAKIQKDDIIFSTMPSGTNHYLGIDRSLWFRQMHYSEYVKRYISNEKIETTAPNGTTYENFVETTQRFKRGWVFADYYFYNVMTDPRVRDHVIRNLTYHFDASTDGTVQVFSWDHDTPEPPKSFVFELGKSPEMQASQQFPINMQDLGGKSKVKIFVDGEAIDDDREAFVVINNAHSAFISQCLTNQRETVLTELDAKWFQPGQNVIQFGYNRNAANDARKGFAVYNVSFSSE
ncbi:glycosyltransferase family 39 protein [bacterium]|nr:glycosyltransferase family 39 protein [bacterium]